jgi:hypothetical protein
MSTPTTPFYPMTHDDAQELIAAIGDESKLAQAYDSTRTYTKDEHCIYSGKLYKCISTISTAEAWTAAHWEEATVGDELTEHKKDIDAICQTVTGANNNTGHTINSGEYFIANGAKYKANAAIPNGEPWASSADQVSDNDLINALNSNITTEAAFTSRRDCSVPMETFADTVATGRLQYFRMRYGEPSSSWNYSTGFVFAPSSSEKIVVMFSREGDGIIMKSKWNGEWTNWKSVGLT